VCGVRSGERSSGRTPLLGQAEGAAGEGGMAAEERCLVVWDMADDVERFLGTDWVAGACKGCEG